MTLLPAADGGASSGSSPAGGGRSPWVAMSVILMGTIMVVLDTTIVNVALPQIGDALGGGRGVEWIVSSYLLAVAVSLPVTGWVSDRFGHRRIYLLALSAFTLASLACALAPSLPLLVAFRVLQGLGGGALMPVGMAIVLKIFPREQHGRALGIWGVAAMAAPAIGPTVGGYLVTSVSWHWLFLINVPIGVVALAVGLRLLPEVPRGVAGRFDTRGFLSGSIGLAVLVLGLSEANAWGWGSTATIGCLVAGAGLLTWFIRHELRTEAPMLEVRMFRSRTFTMATGITFLVVTAQYARLVFIPLDLESVRGYSAFDVGLMLAPAGLATAVGMTFGGRLADRVGVRLPLILGTSLMATAIFAVAALGLTRPLWVIGGLLVLQGMGMGLHAAPATVAAMNTLPPELLGQGSAMRTLTSQVAGAMSVASLSAVLAIATPVAPTPAQSQTAFSVVFWVAFVGMLGALVLAVRLRPAAVPDPEPIDGTGEDAPAGTATTGGDDVGEPGRPAMVLAD